MFSGIVECTATAIQIEESASLLRLRVERPGQFDDLKIGDSIAVNGVCLTLESFDLGSLMFAVGPETLKITGWSRLQLLSRPLNLERPLRLQDRIHGHLVSGHVDGLATIQATIPQGESMILTIEVPKALISLAWVKGSAALNGVSLTINEKNGSQLEFCVIPETLRRTNLGLLKAGDRINFEADWMARGLLNYLQEQGLRNLCN